MGNLDFGKKAVATSRNSFHKARTFGGIAEGITNFIDRLIKPVIEIHKRVCGPKFLLKVFASYDLARVFYKHRQDLEGLLLQSHQ